MNPFALIFRRLSTRPPAAVRCAALAGAALLAVCLAVPPLRAQSLGKDVNDAIKAGIAYLKTMQLDDGTFDSTHRAQYPDGVTALALLALVKSRVPQDDPVIKNAIDALRYKPYTRTYSAAVRIMAMDALANEKYVPAIHSGAEWLVENFRTDIKEWGYPHGTPDLSNTQYAVLGLWTAERHGFKAPPRLWIDLSQRILKHQREDGGFGYRLGSGSTGSMTTAGITVLTICRDRIPKSGSRQTKIRDSLRKAWEYMERRYSPTGNPVGGHAYQEGNYYYYLYGLERACAVGDKPRLGERDWYRECAAHLVATQGEKGDWGDVHKTCFALLFLRLSTFTAIGRKGPSDLDGAATVKAGDVKPAGSIPFVQKWLLLGPFSDKGEAAFKEDIIGEKEISPKKGRTTEGNRWFEHKSLSKRVDLRAAVARKNRVLAYSFTRVHVRNDCEGLIWFGSDDGSRIFLDGELIHDRHFRKGEGADTHAIPVELKKGVHRLLVKVANYTGTWCFYLRFSAPDGSPLPGVVPFTDPAGPSMREILDWDAPFLGAADFFGMLELDRKAKLAFDSEEEAQRVLVVNGSPEHPAFWIPRSDDSPGKLPQSGGKGLLCVHPLDEKTPVRVYRKVRVVGKRQRLVARVAAVDPKTHVANADWIARLGVYDPNLPGGNMIWYFSEIITAGTEEKPGGWTEIAAELGYFAGKEILVVLECAAGGPHSTWNNEQAFIDEFSVRGF